MLSTRDLQGFFEVEISETTIESWIDDLMIATEAELENLYSLTSDRSPARLFLDIEDKGLAYL